MMTNKYGRFGQQVLAAMIASGCAMFAKGQVESQNIVGYHETRGGGVVNYYMNKGVYGELIVDVIDMTSLLTHSSGEYIYICEKNGATIIDYKGEETTLAVPSRLDDLPVLTIGVPIPVPDGSLMNMRNVPFAARGHIRHVVVSEPVLTINPFALANCTNLMAVDLACTVTNLGSQAFDNCMRLERIRVALDNPCYWGSPDGVVFSKDRVKLVRYPSGKSGRYDVPDGVCRIDTCAFSGSLLLSGVSFPDSMLVIEDGAFFLCSALVSADFSASLTDIGDYGFYGCATLKDLRLPPALRTLGKYAFSGCANLTAVTIPAAITSVNDASFAGCANLVSINLPSGVTNIGDYAFSDCAALKDLRLPPALQKLGKKIFFGCEKLQEIHIPASVESIGREAFSGCRNLKAIIFVGDRPTCEVESTLFLDSPDVIIYRRPCAKGWGETFGGRPTAVWKED